jgi:phospholipase C
MRAYSLGPCLCLVLLAAAACKPPRRHAPRKARGHAHALTVPSASAASSATAVTSARTEPAARSALERRQACEFKKGDLPEKTLAVGDPLGQRIPIDHFVIVMQENRSFDHYFQELPKFGQPEADVAPPDYQNHDSYTDRDVKPFHQTSLCGKDTRHDWNSAHAQFDGGKMDGFVYTSNPKGKRALGYYDATDLAFYYTLANTFAIGDRYFASMLGPTWPNRMFFHSGTTFGHIGNAPPKERIPEDQSLFQQLSRKGIEWVVYAEGMTFEEKIFTHLHDIKGDHFKDLDGFFADAKANTLPAYVWIESSYGGPDATDEHPPADVQLGQRFVAHVIDALMKSPAWSHSALFIMYDEPGGFFDHVPPPAACPPDDIEPMLEKRHVRARFDRLGMRTPFIVVSPFAKAHYVSHQTYSHSSVPRLVQARFELPALSARDANSTVPFDMFDFENPPFLSPPSLPDPVVDVLASKVCHARFRKKKPAGKTVDVPDYGTPPPAASASAGDPEGPEEEPETAPDGTPSGE